MNVEEMVKRLNPVLRGWANYFKVADCKKLFVELMKWIRRRLRMNSASPLISMALPNSWFAELELIDLASYNVGILHYTTVTEVYQEPYTRLVRTVL
ncbi:MAG: group II intron maturase-specific domain-containing protein [Clostridia bacterium]|nr:group II intron maturase-specific domain-containing protein [Clostridia bacterium]